MPVAGIDRLRPAGPAFPLSPSASPADWQREDERRAPAFLGLAPDLASKPFDDEPDQIEAQPGALGLDHVDVLRAIEFFEESTARVRRDADPAVGDRPPRHAGVLPLDADRDVAAARRV